MMKCVICRKGETKAGIATMTLDKAGATLVFKSVPARKIAASLLKSAAAAARSGIQVEIRQFSAA